MIEWRNDGMAEWQNGRKKPKILKERFAAQQDSGKPFKTLKDGIMENQPKSYKNGISENQLKSQNTESWISRNPLRQNDGKSPES